MVDSEKRRRVLYFIACGAAPAKDVGVPIGLSQDLGWEVYVIATPSAMSFIDSTLLAELTGHRVRSAYEVSEVETLVTADAVLVAPATFNTINKIACGIAGTLVVGLVCEYLGLEVPVLIAPHVNTALGNHVAFQSNLKQLAESGAVILSDLSTSLVEGEIDWAGVVSHLPDPQSVAN